MEISLNDLKELMGAAKVDSGFQSSHLIPGKKYLFRTVTMIYTGLLKAETKDYFVLSCAAWIADTGRWAENLISCEFSEVEMYPANRDVVVYKSGMLDVVEIDKLPTVTK